MRPCDTVAKCLFTPLMSPFYTETPWTTPSVTVARKSSTHAHIRLSMLTVPNSKVKILNILKLPYRRMVFEEQGHFAQHLSPLPVL